jgi:hypothetical protein
MRGEVAGYKMSKQKNKKYGFFTVDEAAPVTLRDEARLEFFRTIKREKPEILSSLAQDIFASYRSLCKETKVYAMLWGHLCLPSKDKDLRDARLNVAQAILSWATRWHLAWFQQNILTSGESLANGFCPDQTIETLNAWCWYGVPDELDWAYTLRHKDYKSYQVQFLNTPVAFRFDYPSWPVNADTWKSYEKKLDQAYEAAKDIYRQQRLEYTDIVKDLFPPAINKRNPAHFNWLVAYLIEQMTFAAIARKYGGYHGLSERSVRGAIYNLADLLDLTLPRPKVGRPRKT